MLCARIAVLVYTVAKAHNFLFVCKRLADVALNVSKRTNFLKHHHNRFIRTAMQWPFQCADCRGYAGINIRQSRNRYTRCKSRGIQFVIGMKHQRLIERFHGYLSRFITC
ncbi:hypothetical protein D3C78_1456690 [compost metagenome]